jgi:hypothetical protein
MRKLETFDWWPELVNEKDAMSLRELADKFSVTPGAISAALKRTGTGRKPASPGPKPGREDGDELPPEAGEMFEALEPEGDPGRPGSKDHLINAQLGVLGQVPDAEIARRAHVSVRTVASFRARHRIPAYNGPRRKAAQHSQRKSRIDPYVHLLGSVADRVVADQAGVSLNAVRSYRAKHQIAAAGRQAAVPVPDVSAPTRSVATGRDQAWQVVIRHGTGEARRIVVAPTVILAAETASSAAMRELGGDIVSVRWIAEVLG